MDVNPHAVTKSSAFVLRNRSIASSKRALQLLHCNNPDYWRRGDEGEISVVGPHNPFRPTNKLLTCRSTILGFSTLERSKYFWSLMIYNLKKIDIERRAYELTVMWMLPTAHKISTSCLRTDEKGGLIRCKPKIFE